MLVKTLTFLCTDKECFTFPFHSTGQGRFSACPPSIAWTAPEVLQNPNSLECDEDVTSKACDVYSFSIVMWELVMCDDPFEEMSTLQEVGTSFLQSYSLFKVNGYTFKESNFAFFIFLLPLSIAVNT